MRAMIATCFCFFTPPSLSAQAPEGYYHDPTIHGERIVFGAEGDLWIVGAEGGVAQRLTTGAESEEHPAISPDGRTLAFSASYEGPVEVYTMPVAGGLPTRRTYDGGSARIVGWTPDGKLLYSTSRFSTLPNSQIVMLVLDTGERTLLPLAQAARGSYDPGGTLFFTRIPGIESETKRYNGGLAPKIWKYAPGSQEAQPLTSDYAGISDRPMWWNRRIYFQSDRDGTMNLWSMNPDGGDLRQHSFHDGWDVKDAALEGGRIVYQLGANIWLHDIAANDNRLVPITLTSDFDQRREHWVDNPMDYLEHVSISPHGDRVALTARGKVFVAPVGHGRLVEATPRKDVRYRHARFLDEGSLIVMSDQSGEVEWWTIPATGLGRRTQVTRNGTALRHAGMSSPDGKWLITYDHALELSLYHVESGRSERIDISPEGGYGALRWSPDSRWFAYVRPAAANNNLGQVHVQNVEDGTHLTITTDRYHSFSPVWSPDGEWIYFLSNRHFDPIGDRWSDAQPYFREQTQLYAIALREGARWPFQPSTELRREGPTGRAQTTRRQVEQPDPSLRVSIEPAGIAARLFQVPAPPGDYSALSMNGHRLFWVSADRSRAAQRRLMALTIDNDRPGPITVVEGIRDYELSADGEKLLVHKGDELYVIAASAGAGAPLDDGRVDLANWKFAIDPREEWRQMFVDAWRLQRDYFYDPNMHGIDWPAMLEKYLPLVDRLTTRDDLNHLQAQMMSELSALHTFVFGGDRREGEDDIDLAALGAVLSRAEPTGGYRVDHVYRTDPDEPTQRSPLAMPDIAVVEGDIIEAVNGVPTLSVADIGALLRNQAARQIRLTVKGRADGQTRDAIVTPISMRRDADLRYDEWEYTRRLMTERLGEGAIGYLHLRAMGTANMAEWKRGFDPVLNREGLIIDVRHNRGGNINRWLLERLLRQRWSYVVKRNRNPGPNMENAFWGHVVLLVDEYTISDGEIFAEGFRRLGLGQVIGTRTWGGGMALTWTNGLVDGGIATAGEWGFYGSEGEWLVEGQGVEPDIVIDNLPHATFNGDDAQLRAAVKHLQRLIREDPRPTPPLPPYPDKSFRGTHGGGGGDGPLREDHRKPEEGDRADTNRRQRSAVARAVGELWFREAGLRGSPQRLTTSAGVNNRPATGRGSPCCP